MKTLKDGTQTHDHRLDRLIQFDERSRNFPIRALLQPLPLRSYTWRCNTWLDQGHEGACVGFALSHELAARPIEVVGVTEDDARELYYNAQKLDRWQGGEYPGAYPVYSGTSVLAGLLALRARGAMETFRWAFGLNDVLLGVGYRGPCVIGINWYESMYTPDSKGFIAPEGDIVGGHAILVRAVNVKEGFVTLRNSWSRQWGMNGDCRMTFASLDRLLHEQGEAAFLAGRKHV